MRKKVIPKSRDHWLEMKAKYITSTEIGALFDISPYTTEFELYHRKKEGNVVEIDSNERMELGISLQSAIAEHIAGKQNWNVRNMDEFIYDDELRIGSSFDFSIESKIRDTFMSKGQSIPLNVNISPGDLSYHDSVKVITSASDILEIKNVDSLIFRNTWEKDDDGKIVAPLHIEIQAQFQLLVSDRKVCYIGVCIGGNHIELLKRDRNEKIIAGILQKVKAFWQSIEDNIPPEPNFETDSEFIAGLYGYAEPDKLMDASENQQIADLASEYKKYATEQKEAKAKKKGVKAELLTLIGTAEKVLGNMFSISCGTVGPVHVEYDRKGYRMFKVNWKKVG